MTRNRAYVTFNNMKVAIETKKAIHVLMNNQFYWIPKSVSVVNLDGSVSIEHWVCKEKGLI